MHSNLVPAVCCSRTFNKRHCSVAIFHAHKHFHPCPIVDSFISQCVFVAFLRLGISQIYKRKHRLTQARRQNKFSLCLPNICRIAKILIFHSFPSLMRRNHTARFHFEFIALLLKLLRHFLVNFGINSHVARIPHHRSVVFLSRHAMFHENRLLEHLAHTVSAIGLRIHINERFSLVNIHQEVYHIAFANNMTRRLIA